MEISDIKSRLTILEVLTHYTLKPDRNRRLQCPWHPDKTPSLQIYPKTNTWTCFSSNCHAGSGDQIDFIMLMEQKSRSIASGRYEKIDKHSALLKAIAMISGSSITVPRPLPTASLIEDQARIAILTKYYQGTLQSMQRGTHGLAYAKKRGLDPEKLSIGFCAYDIGKTWNKDLQENAEKTGLYKIRNCIIFPLKNKEGQIVSIYGRSISESQSNSSRNAAGSSPSARHFYLAGGFKGLYPSYPRLRSATDGQAKSDTIKLILTESIIDAATIKQYTDYEVLALYGTNGFTPEHGQVIKELESLQEIILFFDGDEAGRAAIGKYSKLITEIKPDIKVSHVVTPEGEDPNSLIQGHSPEILNHLIEHRIIFSTPASSADRENKNESHKIIASKEEVPPVKTYEEALDTGNPELLTYHTSLVYILILGGIKISGLDRLRVTLKIERSTYSHHLPVRHSLDLYHTKQVEQLTQKIAESLELGTAESERTISKLTSALEQYRQSKLDLLKPKKEETKTLTDKERAEAIAYLKDPKLLRHTLRDITRSGIVGESNNALIANLAYTSRKREKPLHIICLGASGTGKTYLQEKVNELIPEEDKIEITSLSDNAF